MIVHRKLTALTAAALVAASLLGSVPAAAQEAAPGAIDPTAPPSGDFMPLDEDATTNMPMDVCGFALSQARAALARYRSTGNRYWLESYTDWMRIANRC